MIVNSTGELNQTRYFPSAVCNYKNKRSENQRCYIKLIGDKNENFYLLTHGMELSFSSGFKYGFVNFDIVIYYVFPILRELLI